jgi:hypothetical protein
MPDYPRHCPESWFFQSVAARNAYWREYCRAYDAGATDDEAHAAGLQAALAVSG